MGSINARFSSNSRLRTSRDFSKVYKDGVRVYANYFVVYFFPAENRPFSRLGLSVSKKRGSAVDRNFIKRRLRHVFRESDRKSFCSFDAIIVVLSKGMKTSFFNLKNAYNFAVDKFINDVKK